MKKMKKKKLWVIKYTEDNKKEEYFDGSSLTQKLNKAYVFDNKYIATQLTDYWNGIEHCNYYSVVCVTSKKSVKICA